jgi:RNA polymerase sigma-70 factor (ECF subfamily)
MKKTKEQLFDELLVLQFQSGNKKALALLWNRWAGKIQVHANRFTKNKEAAKDVSQESWIIILRKIGSLRDPARFGVWALSIVSKKAIDWVRSQQRKHSMEKEIRIHTIETADSGKSNSDRIRLLSQEIKNLPDKQQIVLKLFYVENFNIRQIASILNIKTGTVKSRLFTAREQLKRQLKTKQL